ncbi:uncharacterized protein MONOS_7111 [Monocercomonoides exilis]|uniref:uncharacterized protein n=1 Tax=Monocercomonoides exilis TaxID=2049356 RepID=UPI00355992F9|nr:hypothetical protein MONOS_7111 [Monocercomonoides exilis]|eukprot:MONOS_7111.1-p1 / transcript=MONOS_7111.1 / gene=MONOS_7111 / organism=Monocercomonoides_exilis_PA203 / gene_product=unspecified product / transcript_product=unspecified product / location=Mono_scaffold00236:40373-41609(-) / protein_length=358 / sequence_SO=supercontig / SO=protein_coding / is_pseudo=false
MTQDTVRMPNREGKDRGFDHIHRLSRVENMIEEITRSQTWPMQSGATGMLPMRKNLIARGKQQKRERLRRTYIRMKRRGDEENSDWDLAELERQEEMEGTKDFIRIFPWEWLTHLRQASELRKFIEFCKAGSIRMSDDILYTFIPESEKEFVTVHTDTSWNALARTAITTNGRRDSPEASRAIELLQPALESGFEAEKAIAALTVKEQEKAHLMEEEKERLRGLFCAYALIAEGEREPEEAGREHKLFSSRGRSIGYGASPDSTTGFGPATARRGLPRIYSSGRSTQGFVFRQLQRRGKGKNFTCFRGKKRTHQFQAQFVPTIAGRPFPIIGPSPPSPPRTQGGTVVDSTIGASERS